VICGDCPISVLPRYLYTVLPLDGTLGEVRA
jgi:hypothetical protein